MAVGIVLTGKQEIRLVHWAARLARGRNDGLGLFWAIQRRGDAKRASSRNNLEAIPEDIKAICHELDAGDFRFFRHSIVEDEMPDTSETEPQLPLEVISICAPEVHLQLEEELNQLGVKCLIVPRARQIRSGSHGAAMYDHLLSHVKCEIVLLTPGSHENGECRCIVTPVGEGPHSASCLRMANDIAKVSDAKLVALHVEPEFDETSKQAAKRILTKTVDRALGFVQERVAKKVVLSNDVVSGIHQTLEELPDLIILGMKRTGIVRRFSAQGIAEKLINSNPGPSIAVVQSAIPLSSQVGRRVDEFLRDNIPQLPRDKRVRLVESIQRSSQWDFDFILLICMSTLIAAGGLIENSPAVVIGAMLVAPLMTPLLGTGLSITQGNSLLFRGTLLTVMRGFLVAFVISFVVGMLAANHVTSEMAARGEPRVLDIFIAMIGGIAAAYATGRPNLISALPGVAIAASLVPPIATSGMATWLGDFELAIRAALLFLTNIVAIVLGTWIAFRSVGIRGSHEHGDYNRWAVGAGAALISLVCMLGVYEAMPSEAGADLLMRRLNKLAEEDEWNCTDVLYSRDGSERVVNVHLASPRPISLERLERIRQAVKDAYDSPPKVKFTATSGG